MVEKEYKFLLDQDDYDRLLNYALQHYGKAKTILQTNYYFDTEDLMLYKQGTTLRVREKSRKYLIEKKEFLAFHEGYRTANETCFPVDILPDAIFPADVGIERAVYFLGKCPDVACYERFGFLLNQALHSVP